MPSTVEIYHLDKKGNDVLAGLVTWDGQKIRVKGPKWLLNLMREPIGTPKPGGGGLMKVTFKDGEAFLRGLAYQYRGAYLRASEVIEKEEKQVQT